MSVNHFGLVTRYIFSKFWAPFLGLISQLSIVFWIFRRLKKMKTQHSTLFSILDVKLSGIVLRSRKQKLPWKVFFRCDSISQHFSLFWVKIFDKKLYWNFIGGRGSPVWYPKRFNSKFEFQQKLNQFNIWFNNGCNRPPQPRCSGHLQQRPSQCTHFLLRTVIFWQILLFISIFIFNW